VIRIGTAGWSIPRASADQNTASGAAIENALEMLGLTAE
jgi:hypothetical protein